MLVQDLNNNATAPWTKIQATNPFNSGRRLSQAATVTPAAAPAAADVADAPYNTDLTKAGKTTPSVLQAMQTQAQGDPFQDWDCQ